jgi:hypothetical protein
MWRRQVKRIVYPSNFQSGRHLVSRPAAGGFQRACHHLRDMQTPIHIDDWLAVF